MLLIQQRWRDLNTLLPSQTTIVDEVCWQIAIDMRMPYRMIERIQSGKKAFQQRVKCCGYDSVQRYAKTMMILFASILFEVR